MSESRTVSQNSQKDGESLGDKPSNFLSYPSQPSNQSSEGTETPVTVDSDTRLWIGNLDARLREFHLLKLVQRYGTIDNFDFLFHRTGPNIGLPRGYAFVTFQNKEDAEKCLKSLDGTKVLDKHVAVRWAHQAVSTYIDEETKLKAKLPALSMKKDDPEDAAPNVHEKARAISAIEAKLQAMEKEKDAGVVAGSSSSGFFYQYNKEQPVPTIKPRPKSYDRARSSHNQRKRPYRR